MATEKEDTLLSYTHYKPVMSTIKTRRSVRIFDENSDVDNATIIKIIEAGNYAPSYCNTQAWRFIIIRDKTVINKIVELDAAAYLKKAPVCVLVLYDKRSDNPEYKDYIQSAAACIQNMLLTAHSLGIDSCWTCHLPRKRELKKILRIPWHYEPIAILPFGRRNLTSRKEIPYVARKKKPEELISYNKFEFDEPTPKRDYKLHIKKICRKAYYYLPPSCRKLIRKSVNNIFERRFETEEAYEEK